MRKLLLPLLVILVFGGFFGWRALQPPLTDNQQIAANLEAISAAAKARRPRGITNFLAKEFKLGDLSKSEFQSSLTGGILQFRVIDLQLSGIQNQVNGEKAQSTGNYVLSLKPEFTSPAQTSGGKFTVKWRKIEGEWKIISASVPKLGQLTN